MSDQLRMLTLARAGGSIQHHEPVEFHTRIRVEKFYGDLSDPVLRERWDRKLMQPYDFTEDEYNLLTTIGATDLWNGLVTSGLGTPWSSTNAGLAVGDSTTAEAAGQTDLQAAAGTTITTSGISAATNVSPIVLTNGSGNWTVTPVVGQAFVVATVNGNTAANGTFEVQAATTTTLTLLNSTGNGAFSASASATVKLINRYLQIVNGAPSVSGNQVSFVSVFGSANGNHAWNEFATVLGQASTNKQAAPPSKMLNRKVPTSTLGTKGSGTSWTFTEQITLS